MLVLTRKLQETIQIGDNITVTILRVKGRMVRVGIDAPKGVRVMRTEILNNESKAAAEDAAVCETTNQPTPAVAEKTPAEVSMSTTHERVARPTTLPQDRVRPTSDAPLSLHISRRFRIITPAAPTNHETAVHAPTLANIAVAAS